MGISLALVEKGVLFYIVRSKIVKSDERYKIWFIGFIVCIIFCIIWLIFRFWTLGVLFFGHLILSRESSSAHFFFISRFILIILSRKSANQGRPAAWTAGRSRSQGNNRRLCQIVVASLTRQLVPWRPPTAHMKPEQCEKSSFQEQLVVMIFMIVVLMFDYLK